MALTKQQRKKLNNEHQMQYLHVTNNWVCKHDRLLWPCPAAKLLWALQEEERRTPGHANGKTKSA